MTSLQHHVHTAPGATTTETLRQAATSAATVLAPPPVLLGHQQQQQQQLHPGRSVSRSSSSSSPDHVTSVPNPFAVSSSSAPAVTVHHGGGPVPLACRNWSVASNNHTTTNSSTIHTNNNVNNPIINVTTNNINGSSNNQHNSNSNTQSYNHQNTNSSTSIAASGIRVPAAPMFSMGSSPTSPSVSSAPGNTTTASRRKAASTATTSSAKEPTGGLNNRRQKRLERNRESARLSRRRRKQYLEVLEERVTQLSDEMDKGRREHVFNAISSLRLKRRQALDNLALHLLQTNLSRTTLELRVANTFQTQQVTSLALPPQTKFLLWLSLQTEAYFRGGRAASERLSAARIGERMLCNGNDRVPPAHGMWPLFCNEVGLSYDQEERVRNFQRTLLAAPETWLDRHTAAASGRLLQSAHDCVQAVHHAVGQRERALLGILNDSQRITFLHWAARNSERLAKRATHNAPQRKQEYSISSDYHDAANLYILHHKLQTVVQKLPSTPVIVTGPSVKRLSIRPSFESLGNSASFSERQLKDDGHALTREISFSSSGSLKRSASELEIDDERSQIQGVSPEDAQVAAQPTIDAALGFIKDILPSPPPPPHVQADRVTSSFGLTSKAVSAPVLQQTASYQFYRSEPAALMPPAATMPYTTVQPTPITSFAPPSLNVVPEEGLGTDPADDFLFELSEEDWAIGEGFEMDTT